MNKNKNGQEDAPVVSSPGSSEPGSGEPGSGAIGVNVPATDFKLWSTESLHPEREISPPPPGVDLESLADQFISLKELRGYPVILVYYPADWSPVCGDQVVLYNEPLPEFRWFNATLHGLSVDSPWCHRAFAKDGIVR
jgi:alkyl hydroperoxide reductase subunit AhpC